MSVYSIVDELVASMPSDMPDLKEATDHLAPLNLPAQIVIYYPERQDRLGWVVGDTCHPLIEISSCRRLSHSAC